MDKLNIALQYLLPKHALSRLVGKLAQAKAGAITTAIIKWFIKRYQIDMSEAEQSNPAAYTSFNAFFTRALKAGVRPLCEHADMLIEPVDGTISQCGAIKEGRIFQAKGHDFSALSLLGNQVDDAKKFSGGDFATIYLAPKDYHRIHMPISGTLTKMTYIPGDLFSVNPLTAKHVPELFARNERVVALFDTEIGPMAMILVGATIVASIETVWAGTITPPAGKKVVTWEYPTDGEQAVKLDKGQEMGRFKLGSTVILLFAKDALQAFDPKVKPGAITRMGQAFAKIK